MTTIQAKCGYIADYINNDMLKYKYIALQYLEDLQLELTKAKDQNFRRNKLVDNLRREIEELKKKLKDTIFSYESLQSQIRLNKYLNR